LGQADEKRNQRGQFFRRKLSRQVFDLSLAHNAIIHSRIVVGKISGKPGNSNFSTGAAISALICALMVKKFMSLLAAVAVIGGGATLVTAQSSPVLDEGVAPHNGLDEIYQRFAEGYRKLDPAVVANLYSETAAYLAPGKEIEIGRARVLATFTEFFDSVRQKNGRLEISFRIAQRQGAKSRLRCGDLYLDLVQRQR
jgi:hypothetical protein